LFDVEDISRSRIRIRCGRGTAGNCRRCDGSDGVGRARSAEDLRTRRGQRNWRRSRRTQHYRRRAHNRRCAPNQIRTGTHTWLTPDTDNRRIWQIRSNNTGIGAPRSNAPLQVTVLRSRSPVDAHAAWSAGAVLDAEFHGERLVAAGAGHVARGGVVDAAFDDEVVVEGFI
jgi:hypothetical protein